MGQKVNPTLFRSGLKKNINFFPLSPTKSSVSSHLLIQEIEIRKFLFSLLRSRGILLRSCRFSRTSENLCLDLDLYFTSLFAKESKLSWVRSIFKNMKKKYSELDKVKDVKLFLDSSKITENGLKVKTFYQKRRFRKKRFHKKKGLKGKSRIKPLWRFAQFGLLRKLRRKKMQSFIKKLQNLKLSLNQNKKLILKQAKKKHSRFLKFGLKRKSLYCFRKFRLKSKRLKSKSLVYKRRLLYLLMFKKLKGIKYGKNEEENLFSVSQSHLKSSSDFGRLDISKLYRLFGLRKLKHSFSSFFLRDFLCLKKRSKTLKSFIQSGQSLLELNKLLCQSVQSYCGIEEVTIRLSSAQLLFLPSFKIYKKFLIRKLSSLKRDKDLKKNFLETVELFYFVLGSFGQGNASLVARYISRLLEKTRKQLLIVKFLKKCLQLFFEKMPKSFLAVEGIRILIKGRFNKRRRTKKIVISQGQISLQSLDTCLDYSQTQAITLYGSFGIKIWISRRKDFSFN